MTDLLNESITSFLVCLGILALLFIIGRELINWYWKINERVSLQKQTNILLEQILFRLKGSTDHPQVFNNNKLQGSKNQKGPTEIVRHNSEIIFKGDEYNFDLQKLRNLILTAKKNFLGASMSQQGEILSLVESLCENKEDALYLCASYSKLFGYNLISELKKLSANGDAIKRNLSVFIDFGILEPEYPHTEM